MQKYKNPKIIDIGPDYIRIQDLNGELEELNDSFFKAVDQVKELYIFAPKLLTFPPALNKVRVSDTVFLSNNKCKTLPDFVTQSTDLKSLVLDCSQLRFKEDLKELKVLKYLRIRNFYGKKWPQQIAELPKLKEIDIDGKIGKKCSHSEIVEGLGKSISLKKVTFSFKLDFSIIGDKISLLSHLKNLEYYSPGIDKYSLSIALLDAVRIAHRFEKNKSLTEFQELNFDAGPDAKKILFALFLNRTDLLTDLIDNPFSMDEEHDYQLCFSKRPAKVLTDKIKNYLPLSKMKVNKDLDKEDVFVINSKTDLHILASAFREQQVLATEDHLKELLTNLEDPWLRQQGNEDSVLQIYHLIVSNQVENILLALQIIDGTGATRDIISMVAVLMMAHPDKEVAKVAEKLFKKIGPASSYDYIKKSGVYLRMSSNSDTKLNKLFKHDFGIEEMPFRILHALIAGENPRIRDVRTGTLNMKAAKFNGAIPSMIKHFSQVKKIILQKVPGIQTAESFRSLGKMENLTSLDLSGSKVAVSDEIALLKDLKYLDLSSCSISNSDGLKSLKKLNFLNLEGCKLNNFDFLNEMKDLQILNLGRSALTKIPEQVLLLPDLRVLILKQNKIKDIPDELCSKKLRELDLSGNQIREINYKLFDISALKELKLNSNSIESFNCRKINKNKFRKLQILKLSNNNLPDFKIMQEQLMQLRELDLSRNKLTKLHDSIFNCTSVNRLSAANNEIILIPESVKNGNFREINLKKNKITELPGFLSKIYIEKFDLQDNEINYIHESLTRKRNDYGYYRWNLKGNPKSSLYG